MASFPRPMSVASPTGPSRPFAVPLRSDDNGNPLPTASTSSNRQSFTPYRDAPTSPEKDSIRTSGFAVHARQQDRYSDLLRPAQHVNPFEPKHNRSSRYMDASEDRTQRSNNRQSIQGGGWGGHHEGYQQDDFNVANDFNNAGPTYMEVYGGGEMQNVVREQEEEGAVSPTYYGGGGKGVGANGGRPGSMRPKSSYRPASHYSSFRGDDAKSTKALLDIDRNNPNGVEMVTVPALGPEWADEEIYRSSKKGRSELTSEKRGRAWKEWRRGHSGLCGINWLTRRALVVAVFGFLVVLGLILYFTIPRPPVFSLPTSGVWTTDNDSIAFSRTPANYSFTGQINLFADASSTYVPVHISTLSATVYDYATAEIIGKGALKNRVLKRVDAQPVSIPVEWSYVGTNSSDATWLDMYNACSYIYTGTVRPDISFRIVVDMHIVGLVTKPSQFLTILNLECPFERASNSV